MALHAAETGHLVISTLHTLDAKETINRIISVFPTSEQNRIRIVLASVLRAVVSQRLVKTVTGGQRAALEILVNTARASALIEEARENELTDVIEEGDIYGMQSFDQALLNMYKQKIINKDEALKNASNKNDMVLMINQYESGLKNKDGKNGDEGVIDLKL
jgi:twitching motility protein PilT